MRPAQGLSPRSPVATDVTAFSTCSRPSRCVGANPKSYGNTAPWTAPEMESHEPAHTVIPPTSSCTKYHNPKAGVKQRPTPPPLRFAVLVADTLLSMGWVGTTGGG